MLLINSLAILTGLFGIFCALDGVFAAQGEGWYKRRPYWYRVLTAGCDAVIYCTVIIVLRMLRYHVDGISTGWVDLIQRDMTAMVACDLMYLAIVVTVVVLGSLWYSGRLMLREVAEDQSSTITAE